MPFSLCNAPATFQCLMQECLGELNLTYALIYLDDIIIFSSTPEEHLIHLRAMLERFLEHGLKLKPSKCHFFRTEIDYLGHKVSADGMTPGTDNVRGIAEMAPPYHRHRSPSLPRSHWILPTIHKRIRQDSQTFERPLSGRQQQAQGGKSQYQS